MENLSSAALKKLVRYDPETGEFTWLVSNSNRVKVGDRAGSQRSTGYRALAVLGKLYQEHRLAWLYMTGEWPEAFIDHRNGSRNDNRWANLRAATKAENGQNYVRSAGKSGLVGATRRDGGWVSQIRVSGRPLYLGYFKTPEEASAAYVAAKLQHHVFQPIDRRQQ